MSSQRILQVKCASCVTKRMLGRTAVACFDLGQLRANAAAKERPCRQRSAAQIRTQLYGESTIAKGLERQYGESRQVRISACGPNG